MKEAVTIDPSLIPSQIKTNTSSTSDSGARSEYQEDTETGTESIHDTTTEVYTPSVMSMDDEVVIIDNPQKARKRLPVNNKKKP